eukprot:m.66003 g.66003  ORF g.66003 m.66003 type:complete len:567 (-) comp14031_c0_seq1:100-1800(-)
MAEAPAAATAPTPAATSKPTTGSLYVGNLSPTVTENDLFQTFTPFGAVSSVRICRDMLTKQSLGYGYVNYVEPTHAAQALNDLKFEDLGGRPMRISWCQRDPTKRRTGVGNIFIRNLHESIDDRALHDTFATFGTIASCKVVTDKDGKSRGFGFVQYETPKDAETAIEKVNGKLIKDLKVYVAKFKTRKQRMDEFEAMKKNFKNVFVKELPDDITEEEFVSIFSEFGEISSSKLMKVEGRDNKPIGFVAYNESSHAQAAVTKMHEQDLRGHTLYVARAQTKAERMALLRREHEKRKRAMQSKYQGGNLYVRGFPEDFTEEDLRQAFSSHGTITSIKIAKHEDDSSKGFGFVCFSSNEEAVQAQLELHGTLLEGKPLHVSMHQTKEERQAELAKARQQQAMMQQSQMGMPGMMNPQMQMAMRGMMMRPGMPQQMMMPQQQFRNAGPRMPMGQPQGVPQGAPQGAPQSMRPPQQQPAAPQQPALPSMAQLQAMEPNQQKQVVGNFIYPQIVAMKGAGSAPKLTGMVLEQSLEALYTCLKDSTALQERVDEAHKVLLSSQGQGQAQGSA